MNKALFIIGLLLVLVGLGMLGWIYQQEQSQSPQQQTAGLEKNNQGEDFFSKYDQWLQLPEQQRIQAILGEDANGIQQKTDEQIYAEQQERLKADLVQLASGDSGVESYADLLYGHNWRQKVEEYKLQQQKSDTIVTTAIICTSIGALLTVLVIMYSFITFVVHKFWPEKQKQTETIVKRSSIPSTIRRPKTFRSLGKENQGENFFGIMDHPSWAVANKPEKTGQQQNLALKSGTAADSEQPAKEPGKEWVSTRRKIKTSLTEKLQEQGIAPKKDKSEADKEKPQAEKNIQHNITLPQRQDKKAVAKNVQSKTDVTEKNEPINSTLMELTQQVSAIREYAANQQNSLRRYQDGYDWNIIKNFCMRIIRCIDNIEGRMMNLSGRDQDTSELEQIRDELVFALESSGVERFEPQTESDYRGQEKFAEVLKEKCSCSDSKLKGKIESVVRPGYQCYLDEENIRVVRPAQVRLYA